MVITSSTNQNVTTNNNHVQIFNDFINGWMIRQENYLNQLMHYVNMGELDRQNHVGATDLAYRVMAHYNEYYEAKSRLARADIFILFSPPWLSSFELTFLWVAGFKPGIAFCAVKNAVPDLSEEQRRRLEGLAAEIKAKEVELEEELAKIQESMAAPPMVAAAMKEDAAEMAAAVEKMAGELEDVVGCGDSLRTKTVVKVMEVLDLGQKVRFLAAVAQFQGRIREWGLQRDAVADRHYA